MWKSRELRALVPCRSICTCLISDDSTKSTLGSCSYCQVSLCCRRYFCVGLTSRLNPGPLDHWAAHLQEDAVVLAKAGYEVDMVAGDGNCLFQAMLASKFQ